MMNVASEVLIYSQNISESVNFPVGSSNSLKRKRVNQEANDPSFIEDFNCPKRKKQKIGEQVMSVSDHRPLEPTNLGLSYIGHVTGIEALTDLEILGDVEGDHVGTSISKFSFARHTIVVDHSSVQNLQIGKVAEDNDHTYSEDLNHVKTEIVILSHVQEGDATEIDKINESGKIPIESPLIVVDNLLVQNVQSGEVTEDDNKFFFEEPNGLNIIDVNEYETSIMTVTFEIYYDDKLVNPIGVT
ncbi:hypothetical protein LIER_36431 [Lithospermum erythrorhizon]|uniref:Uncharacterized protein n=1 Tax=Lithospermum erythrorhizon TaxID=34254 RepID=A0AAV3P792_LITER